MRIIFFIFVLCVVFYLTFCYIGGASIISGVDERDADLWRCRHWHWHWPDYLAVRIEGNATIQRQDASRQMGDRVLHLAITHLVEVLDRQRESERLTAPDGKPANWSRQLVFAGLWDIYADLTGASLPATPPDTYLNLCAVAFSEPGLDTVGLEAAERLFRRAQRRQPMSGS